MRLCTRRFFLTAGSAAGFSLERIAAQNASAGIDESLRSGIASRQIPAVVGMVGSKDQTLYSGAFGKRDDSGVPVTVDSIFAIASMTKAVTTVAALQLVEQGKVKLDQPVSRHLPVLGKVQVLDGYGSDGQPKLRAPGRPITLRHLLTHTSGLCYDTWDGDMFRYTSKHKATPGVPGPLMFDPGKRWQYGQSTDWTGRLVEALSGLSLEEYFQQRILRPLGMTDTSYILPRAKFDRLVSRYQRTASGALAQLERKLPDPPNSFNGGGGLYSTASDYIRFLQMILKGGAGRDGVRVLQEKTVAMMRENQIGPLTAGKMKSYIPNLSSDVDIQPGHTEKWTLGFLLNPTAYDGGRSAGSLAWAGLYNTFYWVDARRGLCAVLLMQFLPFVDAQAVGMLADFERAVYRAK